MPPKYNLCPFLALITYIYHYQSLAKCNINYPYLVIFAHIIALIWSYVPYSTHINILLFESNRTIFHGYIAFTPVSNFKAMRETWHDWLHLSLRQSPHQDNTFATRQSEMANTSPATCQCLATFTPLKLKILIFLWRHFSARSSCYIINWYGYPRGSHEQYLKEIVSRVFEYAIELLHVKRRTCHKWR